MWRNLIAVVVAIILGAVAGFIIGGFLGILGVSVTTIKMITGPIGGLVGLALSVVPIKMILGKDFGKFRLVLVSKAEN